MDPSLGLKALVLQETRIHTWIHFVSDLGLIPLHKDEMAYRRSTSRSRSRGSRDKYSIERYTFQSTVAANVVNNLYQGVNAVVPSTQLQGMRKVKHVTVTVTSTTIEGVVWWALVYVPQGTSPNPLSV